jgi:hypothetical protein
MIDSHYYLKDWRPANTKPGDWYNCVGGGFCGLPGKYELPFNEGLYMVDGNAQIRFRPRRSGSWYVHDNVLLCNTSFAINFGWYSLLMACGNPGSFKLFVHRATGYNTENSVQTSWILEHLTKLKGLKTPEIAAARFDNPWTEQNTREFALSLCRSPHLG